MKWLEEFGKGLINLGNILVGVVAIKSFVEKGVDIGSLIGLGLGIVSYIGGILSIRRSEDDNEY